MLHSTRHDDELTRSNLDRPVPELDAEHATHAKEQLVLVVVVMPHEGAFELDELHFLPVQLTDDLGPPMLVDEPQFLGQVDLLHDLHLWAGDGRRLHFTCRSRHDDDASGELSEQGKPWAPDGL